MIQLLGLLLILSLVTCSGTPVAKEAIRYTPLTAPTPTLLTPKPPSPTIILVVDNAGDIFSAASSPTFAPSLPPNSENRPPDCITDESQIAYVNGEISATQTFYTCIENIPDPYNIPTFYNGTFNGIMMIYNNIQINNLHDV